MLQSRTDLIDTSEKAVLFLLTVNEFILSFLNQILRIYIIGNETVNSQKLIASVCKERRCQSTVAPTKHKNGAKTFLVLAPLFYLL